MQHTPEFEAICEDARRRIREVTVEQLQQWQAQGRRIALIDVREDHEWQNGHIAGAEHLGRGILERDIVGRHPDKAQGLVLYCGGGYRSALAADNLQKMGYRQVFSLAGGWKAWLAAGLATDKPV
jgi:rhodanese-related sulfurtransferase